MRAELTDFLRQWTHGRQRDQEKEARAAYVPTRARASKRLADIPTPTNRDLIKRPIGWKTLAFCWRKRGGAVGSAACPGKTMKIYFSRNLRKSVDFLLPNPLS
jgi:hypothetical protein